MKEKNKYLIIGIMSLLVTFTIILFWGYTVFAQDINLKWDASTGATGYNIYMSTDDGISWCTPQDAGDAVTYTYLGVPATGLILFRVSAYNTQGEYIRYWSGAWYCEDWKPLQSPAGAGVK